MKNFFEARVRSGLKIMDRPWFYPIVLLVVGLAAYGIIFTRPGFFWQDYETIYLYYKHPSLSLTYQYYGVRPLALIPHYLLLPIAYMPPIAWEIATLLLRWLGILFIFFTLNAVWPSQVENNKWVGVLLFVFPGYLSQPVSVTYNRQMVCFLFLAISLYLTVLALKRRKYFWVFMPAAFVLGIMQIFILEYFAALEILRPIIIWFTLRSQNETKKATFSKTLLYWLPYLAGLTVYYGWRFIFIPTGRAGDPNSLDLIKAIMNSPISGLGTLIEMVLKDSGFLLFKVWAATLISDKLNIFYSRIGMIGWLFGFAAALLFIFYIRRTRLGLMMEKEHPFRQMLLFGGVALLAGALPVWVTGRLIDAGKWSDRFTLGPMLGAVILLVYVLDWLFRSDNRKQYIMIILLAASIALQVNNTNDFRKDQMRQQAVYWQLLWRIPNLKSGTTIISSGTFTEKSSYEMEGYVVNLLFSDHLGEKNQYGYFDIYHLSPDLYKPKVSIKNYIFKGNTSQAIGLNLPNNSNQCLKVLDLVYSGDPTINAGTSKIIPISNVNLITTSLVPRQPEPAIFGAEPMHDWCYFFEKADLARQMGDWESAVSLIDEANAKNLKPSSGSEYLPFIEAFAQTGQWSKAYDLSIAAQKMTPDLEALLCKNWDRFQQIAVGQEKDTYLKMSVSAFCGP